MRRPRPVLAFTTSLLAALGALLMLVLLISPWGSVSRASVLLLVGPAIFIVMAIAWWQWSIYFRKADRFRRWSKVKRTVAHTILNLDSFHVTYETIPQEMRKQELTASWESLQSLAFALLNNQEKVQQLELTSDAFYAELVEAEAGMSRLQDLSQAIMGSGNFWSPEDSARTVFDTVLRPINLLVREQLFFLEDVAGPTMKPGWAQKLRDAYSKLVVLADGAASDGFLTPEKFAQMAQEDPKKKKSRIGWLDALLSSVPGSTHAGMPISRQEDGQQLDAATLTRFVTAWVEAERGVYDVAQKIYRGLGTQYAGKSAPAAVLPDPSQEVSLKILRRALGLPVQVQESTEYMLRCSTARSYSATDTNWRPAPLWPSATAPEVSAVRSLIEHKNFRQRCLEDAETFKKQTLFSRLDAEATRVYALADTGEKQRKFIIAGLAGGIVVGLLLLWRVMATLTVNTESVLLKNLLLAPTSFTLGFAVIFIPAALLALRLRWLGRLRRGEIFTANVNKQQIAALRRYLDELTLNLDNSRLNSLVIKHKNSRMLSQRVYERALVLAWRDVKELESLSAADRTSGYENQLLSELSLLVALLQEHRQDIEYHLAREKTPA